MEDNNPCYPMDKDAVRSLIALILIGAGLLVFVLFETIMRYFESYIVFLGLGMSTFLLIVVFLGLAMSAFLFIEIGIWLVLLRFETHIALLIMTFLNLIVPIAFLLFLNVLWHWMGLESIAMSLAILLMIISFIIGSSSYVLGPDSRDTQLLLSLLLHLELTAVLFALWFAQGVSAV